MMLQHCNKPFIIWIFTVLLMCTTDDEVCRLRNMFCKIKYIVFKIKILTVLLLCHSFGNIPLYNISVNVSLGKAVSWETYR